MPAGQNFGDKIHAAAAEVLDNLERVFPKEGEVVGGMDQQNFLRVGGKLVHVMGGLMAAQTSRSR